jgi:thiamine biosynthesis lipoprotein ApbE
MAPPRLTDQIAAAIKDADKRYFFEDYTKQAKSVISALNQAGYAVVPAEPTPEMLEAAKTALTYGAQRPADLVKTIWSSMVKAGR